MYNEPVDAVAMENTESEEILDEDDDDLEDEE